VPTQPLPERLMPDAGRAGLRAFYGDIHNHCAISYGHGRLEQALRNARQQLDFVSVTGHAFWPDMPVGVPEVAHIVDFHVKGFAKLAKMWPRHFDILAEANEPDVFTVFPGYEMHSNAHGDYTILLRDIKRADMPRGDDPASLESALHDEFGDAAMAFPHHIGYRTGARGVNWDTFRESLSPLVEMISMHGCSETSLTDRPFLHSMGPCDGTNTIHNGWNLGHVFGILGNTDHHSGYPGSYGHGRSVVYAPENTSPALWRAMRARHTGALTGDNVHLFATMDGAVAGDIVAPGTDRQVRVEAIAGSFIDYIDLVGNGRVISRVTPAITPSPLSNEGGMLETILTLELGWGARNRYHDWSGEIRLEGGFIDALETRFRGAEIVSPLEEKGEHSGRQYATLEGDKVVFAVRAHANPNNATSATQGLAMRIRLEPGAVIHADLGGRKIGVPAERLLKGALAGNLGLIDTPAFRFHALPRPADWQWYGVLSAGELKPGDWVSVRMRQNNRHWAWTGAFFCR